MQWNKKQNIVINDAYNHIHNSSKQVYEFGGWAGTGKSTVMNEIALRSNIPFHRIAAMSYIGQAAIVMRSKGFLNAKTIHSWCFDVVQGVKRDKEGNVIVDTYFNAPELGITFKPKDLDDIDVIFLDEGYTTPLKLKSTIESKGKKMIVSGDPGQLPPVGDQPAYLCNNDFPILDEIMRQAPGNNILYIAERARKGLPIHCGLYGNVLVIEEKDLTDAMLANACITICGKNETKDKINARVRHYRGYRSQTPNVGEKIICRKNNWFTDVDGISLANGLIGTVTNQYSPLEFDGKTFMIDFKPDLFPAVFSQVKCDYNYFVAPTHLKKELKNDKYAQGDKFDWAYAITAHLSQGAQYSYGIYFEEYLRGDIQNNINYVGTTRFVDWLIYVKPNRKSFF